MSFKKTELGNIPIEWEVERIENVLEEIIDYRGKTPKKANEGIETLSAKSVKNGYIDYSNAYYISPKTYKEFMVRGFPKKDDILLTTEAPLGNVAKLNKDNVAIAQRLLTLRGKENYMANEYLMYYLMSVIGQHQLHSRATGTTVTGIKQSEFRKILITVPTFHEQKSITNILSSLDEKIETNNQINKKLEEMAKTIFKHWFVDFEFPNAEGEPYKSSDGEMVESELGMIPKDWCVEELINLSDINPKETLKKGQESIYVEMANLPQNSARISNSVIKTYSGGTKFRNGDILFARITPCLENGKTAIVDFLNHNQVGFGSTEYIILRPNVLNTYYLYFLVRDNDFRNNAIKNMNGSSGRQRVNVTFIQQYKVVCPPRSYLERFSKLCKPLFEKMKYNDEESRVLSITRDTLLPKLMSGEVRIPIEKG
ncbi:restriction endonuclease subunit S [Bacillus thuringiensis]|uniref:restriction endonuclease subunit S n=1 Tax=Bacillus thuringiensis TaxID=1428 RepID=UPI000BFCAEE7|nr:restriction endonuclease subunit S [Bacillus thuringiensis]PGP49035.1 restriction endonuclease subunit S [Bacillus thuringiensis]